MAVGALTGETLRRPGPWIAVFLLGTAALLNLYSTQPILTELSGWARVDGASAAWTISATTLGVAILAPVAGSISDRLGRKRVMLAAIAAMAVATLCCAIAPGFAWLLAFRVVQGLATPFVFAVAIAYVAEETEPAKTSALNGVYVAGTAFGGFAGRLLSGAVLDAFGSWRLTFVFASALLAAVLIATWLWLPRESRFTPSDSLLSGLRGAGAHLRDWRMLATCFVGAALLFQQVVSFTFGSLHLMEDPFGLSAMQVGLVFVVFLAPAVLTPFVGAAVQRFGTLTAFWLAAILGAAGIALTLIPSTAAVVAGLACSCIAVFAGQSCATGFTGRHARRFTSAAVGIYLTSYYLGGTVAGVAGAPVYSSFGWPGSAVLILVVIGASSLAATAAWRGPASTPAS
ncbi:MFS transporter [Leucobacter celer]|uniref:MFS transporter n=1 Tax=Leucobacter celer TaxID=668625 RepID=UPI0009497B26|nr:MFS transporter [Leucobacter celer]